MRSQSTPVPLPISLLDRLSRPVGQELGVNELTGTEDEASSNQFKAGVRDGGADDSEPVAPDFASGLPVRTNLGQEAVMLSSSGREAGPEEGLAGLELVGTAEAGGESSSAHGRLRQLSGPVGDNWAELQAEQMTVSCSLDPAFSQVTSRQMPRLKPFNYYKRENSWAMCDGLCVWAHHNTLGCCRAIKNTPTIMSKYVSFRLKKRLSGIRKLEL
ncbi:unnamed protein product [Protopolystoma xenopodis]|uniref:Uncharacterized protein n=1 Tax=Protopolystoma xenopodis TaxID=117903 RepID=A0A3S5BRH3_9PLAT|nr:unnamed protein product [Protopolystoma xenopodis]